MSFRQYAGQFFQNIADYLQQDKPPLSVPDYVTGEPHIITSLEKQRAYHNLNRYMKKHLPDFVVVMRQHDGEFQPTAVHKNSLVYENYGDKVFSNYPPPKP